MLTLSPYANTAYRPDQIPQQPTPEGRPEGMQRSIYHTASRLPWGNTEQVISLELINDGDPLSLQTIEKEFYKEDGEIINSLDGAMNHICIRPVSLSKMTAALVYSISFCQGYPIISGVMGVILFFITYFKTDLSIFEILMGMLPVFTIIFIIPLILWIFGSRLLRMIPLGKGRGAKWELNRQTGMITVYKQEQGKRVAYTKPFYEFDAYLVRNPSPQGIIYYNLRLQHRYQDIAIGGFMGSSTGSQEPVWAAWDFIQNYMDTSQPLPEVGAFELFRPYDPTSVEFDKKTNRNPRFRRDMSDEDWKTYRTKLLDDINDINMDRPNLMAQYVDYSALH